MVAARILAFTALKLDAFDSSSEVATAWLLEVALSMKELNSLEAFAQFKFIAYSAYGFATYLASEFAVYFTLKATKLVTKPWVEARLP